MTLGIHFKSNSSRVYYTVIQNYNFHIPLLIAQVRYTLKDPVIPVEIVGIDVLDAA